jgi:hypothetical protein
MSQKDTNLDTVNEIYKNASVALLSISNVLPETENEGLKKELQEEYDGYEKLLGEITAYMTEKGYETKELGVMKKMFMSSGIKMNTALDNTEGHIAQIMVKGTVMGITELCRLLNNSECTDPKVIELGERLKQLEENYEERLKKFL